MSSAFQLAHRFAGVTTSPVRDILAVLSRAEPCWAVLGRAEVISFAGGIPGASLFALADFRAAFDHVPTHQAARALQSCIDEGRA